MTRSGRTCARPVPNWAIYQQAEAKGAAFLLTAREGGALIGYFFLAVVACSLHYRIPEAVADIYYVDCDDAPSHRTDGRF